MTDVRAPARPGSRMPADWTPPVPAWVGRFETPTDTVVMAYFGTQSRGRENVDHLARMNGFFDGADGPANVERAQYTDRAGYQTLVSTAYWTSPARYDAWRESSGYDAWWRAPERLAERAGHYEEVLRLPTDRFETLFSTENLVGSAATGQRIHGPIREHNYWGAMRDRIPAAGANDLASRYGEALPRRGTKISLGKRLRVAAPENLAIIRSGQDSSHCKPEELATYDKLVRPVLVSGMDYLRDNPDETGCCDMRLAGELAADGAPVQRAYGLGYFLTLGHLERWAESHPTHLAIFHRFLTMAKQHPDLKLRLWHEVAVLPGAGQTFEYVNCHPDTGLLPYFPSEEV
jgi:heme-degrading monooxygenase HmoA